MYIRYSSYGIFNSSCTNHFLVSGKLDFSWQNYRQCISSQIRRILTQYNELFLNLWQSHKLPTHELSHLASYEGANTRMELHITMANYHAKRYIWTKSTLVTIVRVSRNNSLCEYTDNSGTISQQLTQKSRCISNLTEK